MVSFGEIAKVRKIIDDRLKHLSNLNEQYTHNVDICNPSGISSNAYFIGKAEEELRKEKDHFSISQGDYFDSLERDYIKNFQRLEKRCECKQKNK